MGVTLTLQRVWDQAVKGTDSFPCSVRIQGIPPSGPLCLPLCLAWGTSACPAEVPQLYSPWSICLQGPSLPFCLDSVFVSRLSSSTTPARKPCHCRPPTHAVNLTMGCFCSTMLCTKVSYKTHDTSCQYLFLCVFLVLNSHHCQARPCHLRLHPPTS